MKTITSSLLILSAIIAFIAGCEKDNSNRKLKFSGVLVNHSDCKQPLKSTLYADSLSCVEYSFDKEKNKLNLKHINSGFNCCPDSIFCDIKLIDDTILIQEYEEMSLCDCNCLYDLDIEVKGVAAQEYIIKFVEPYAIDMDKIEVKVDLENNPNGSYCVTRKHYPWGVNSLN